MPFNIGPGELLLILAIALLVIGPGRLPDVGAALGKSIREFRKASTEVQESVSAQPRAAAPVAGMAVGQAPSAPGESPAMTADERAELLRLRAESRTRDEPSQQA